MYYFVPKRCESTNKIMYHDKVTALQAAEQSRIERHTELWVYQCEFCHTWHLTHRNPQAVLPPFTQRSGKRPHSRKKGFKPRHR
ncbi:hypothetical protein [Bifidobacterium gallicum]|uniref:Uncharacterized protein n=1 Tax=Bifidobacterium gallicum DSM 20093 = LMG 11596 TaxID=561180 RepID=A0A087AKR3_9BIFI|nr:hypothetical protein [Bifidobacterium gallicum]KFI59363.1 hypothetical protein BGLCM_0472 [Bifidobacterium gallicum DSM 20093 = LMG 11596]